MYLKALEIQGFKSFPQKTRLSFEKPITAIVGPNGSGKSNISDAIRWVMGEQSTRALRGGKMEDVIFGGTERRSQVGFAEVSLVIDNEEHIFEMENAEVMITRRYYRSGESEYYINRQAVRLKDVNELLMDTGLGRDGYSIIGQGRIDEILSVRSTDRREIFEEAAGISKFRHRKEESEHKLERTEENLIRVNDKIAELEMQVEPLREQAEKAKRYLILRDELRGLEVTVWLESLDRLREQAEKNLADFTAATRQLGQCKAALEALYGDGERFSAEMREKDVAAEEIRQAISNLKEKYADAESEMAVLRANLKNNLENIERMRAEMEKQDDRDLGIKGQIEERHGRIREIEAQQAEVAAETEKLSEKLEELALKAGETAEELSRLMAAEDQNNAAMADRKERISSLAASLQELEDRSTALLQEVETTEQQLKTARADGETNRKELEAAKESAQSLQNMIGGYTLRLEGRRKKAAEAEDKQLKLTMEAGNVRSRIAMLTEMEREYQGYSKSVKVVMQEATRGILKNIYGPVADLVKTEDSYTLAIETALGAAAQNIIVGREEDGKAAINMLKRRDAGRATFWPASTVKGNRLNERGLEEMDGFVGIALDLVQFNEAYRGVFTHLLGRVVIAEDLDSAVRISRKYAARFRVVTLDGQVMNAGGSMTGGSAGKNTGILSRANELTKLTEHEKILSGELRRAEETCTAAKRELEAAEYELNVAKEELRVQEDAVLRLEMSKAHYDLLIRTAAESVSSLKAEHDAVRARIDGNAEEIRACRAELQDLEAEAETLKEKIQAQSVGQEALVGARQELLDQMSALKAKEAAQNTERETILQAIHELDEIRRDLSGGKQQQQAVVEELLRQNGEIENELEVKARFLTGTADEIGAREREIAALTEAKMEIEAARVAHDKKLQDKNSEVLDLERECARLEQKKLAVEMEEKQIVDKLWDTYELSRTAAQSAKVEVESTAAATRRISEIKREISKLGTPNIGAIDEFERVNTRYTYLTGQRDDIEKAKTELKKIIGEISEKMQEIFRREFAAINTSFKETFVELFGGGRASLELEDPEDILNCGIEIKVQPPGKSVKTITLLSGGEKAFVAIALYFSILKIRPTPFVVMDEIEAALDEANVSKFADYMRRMTDRTQFLVITHRRSTMEEADVLYGVTMQEQGVSQLLNIDLEKAEQTLTR